MSFDSLSSALPGVGVFPRKAFSIAAPDDCHIQTVTVYLHAFNPESLEQRIKLEFHKRATTEELIEKILDEKRTDFANFSTEDFEIYETMGTLDGRTFKERRLDRGEYPVAGRLHKLAAKVKNFLVQLLWPRLLPSSEDDPSVPKNRFVLRQKGSRSPTMGGLRFGSTENSSTIDSFLSKFLNQPQDREYADLCMLPELTEQTLLDNLRDRFNSGHIYTYIGPILVAVNPFNFFPIYNPKYARLYCQSRRLGALPPHIFAIADITYHNMLRIKENQCVVISGESGSGKTESTNFLLHHLTTLSQKGSSGTTVEQTLLSAGPVLEAFGNAVTVQNNNSSRFGKFIKVNYRENGMVSGANVEIYLLEKSRIISQAIGERNYHVFYYLLEGATEEERKQHFLLQPKDYHYLNQNNFFACEAMNERYEYERLKHSMEAVGFSQSSQQKIFGMISAVLLLGNIEFVKRPGYHSDENAYIENEGLITMISDLLNIKAQQLHQALTMRRKVLKNETVITRYTVPEAINTRDAMSKCLYNALFHWIVLKMNQALIRKEASIGKKGYYIGILDIFGFEDVGAQWNSFEQLCINYANEHLQAYFNQHIFQFEQEEYLKEGISWTNIEYTDNTECVQLFQSKPYGILRLIDEESNINNGTDKTMLDKLNTYLKSNEYYEVPHKKEDAFVIAHYAGKVKYQITGFREKNKDLMRQDVMMVLKNSKSAFVRELVGDDPVAVYRWNLVRSVFRAMNAFKNSTKKMKRTESLDRLAVPKEQVNMCGGRRGSDSHLSAFLRGELDVKDMIPEFCDTSVFKTIVDRAKKHPSKKAEDRQSALRSLQAVKELIGKKPISNKPSSVSRQFEYSLNRLMRTLAQATPYFIRCIKSNNEKIPNYFDDNIILRQLRYTGMLETVRIRRAGYSVRIQYDSFINQYRILLPNGRNSTRQDVVQFFDDHPLIETENVQYGRTKIFMRDAEKLLLDDHLHRVIMEHIYSLQRWFRATLLRRRYLRLKSTIFNLQALARGAMVRNKIRRESFAALCMQTNWRRYLAQRRYKKILKTIVGIQAIFRANVQLKRLAELRSRGPPPKRIPGFHITQIAHTIQLSSFDLNDPETLAPFADEDADADFETDFETDTITSLDDEEISDTNVFEEEQDGMGGTDRRDSDDIELDAVFIVEDKRLKLLGEKEGTDYNRRQSLATTTSASATKLKMLRRAASTESKAVKDVIQKDVIQSPGSSKSKGKRIGFLKARKHLKALLTRKIHDELHTSDDEGLVNEPQTSVSTDLDSRIDGLKKTHNFKFSRLYKGETCALCNKTLTGLLLQGYKCGSCKLSFHKECSSFASNIPCTPASPSRSDTSSIKKPWDVKLGNRTPRTSLSPLSLQQQQKSFHLSKTKQQTDSEELIIESIDDLRQFSIFIFKKQMNLDQEKKKRETAVDAIFKKSLREFHMELIGYEAVQTEDKTVLKYRDLIATFEGLLTKVCNQEKVTFPTTLGVNAFRGFLNEFRQQQIKRRGSSRTVGIIKSVRKKRRKSDVTLHNGHRFKLDFVHVPTYCEICNQFMWHAEKIFICMNCRLSCHKKCHTKVTQTCTKAANSGTSNKFFGTDLSFLVDDDQAIPVVLNKLLMVIEVRALFVEGIYRKSGALPMVRNTRKSIETASNYDDLNFEEVPVHVIATLIKSFFRELAEPLITYELYENFLNVSEVGDPGERIRCLSVMTELLPKCNKCVLDRLMYHLARVAHQEPVNRMSASNLAVIFAPCILRRNQAVHAQEQLMDVQKQAVCVQTLIEEKLKQYRHTLTQIVELEHASEKVSENLRKIDEHKRSYGALVETQTALADRKISAPPSVVAGSRSKSGSPANIEAARQLFVEQLDFLDKEKEKLIQELPPLAPVASSEDLSSSEIEHQSPSPRLIKSGHVEYAIDFKSPPVFGVLPNLCKIRPRRKGIRRPSRYANPVVFRLNFDD